MSDEEWEEEATVVGKLDMLSHVAQGRREKAYVIVIAGPDLGQMFALEGKSDIGRGQDASIRLLDTETSRAHARFLNRGGQIAIRDLDSTNGTFVNGQKITETTLEDGDTIQIGTTTILKFSYHDELEEEFQRKMYSAALRDGLTGAFNKKFFLERLDSEMAYAMRHQSSLSLVMFDLDHFKGLNDNYGHLAGDYVLKTLGAGIQAAVRGEDVFSRYGGEEFVVLSRGIDLASAMHFAERLRTWVAEYPFVFEGQTLPVTTSLGVASFPQTAAATGRELLKKADQALYRAKGEGRNRVASA